MELLKKRPPPMKRMMAAPAFWPFGTERERGAFIIIKIEIGIRRKKKQIHYGGTAAQAAIHFNQGSGSPYVHCGLFEVKSDSCKAGKGRSALLLHRYNFALSFSSVFASDRGCVSSV